MARPHALVALLALLALLALPSAVRAEVIDLPDTRAELTLDTRTWRVVPVASLGQASGLVPSPGQASGLVWGAATARGERLSITRAQIPNIDAWRSRTRDAYVAQIEKGLVAAGYKPTARKLTTIEGVPVLDIEADVLKRAPRPKAADAKAAGAKAADAKTADAKAADAKAADAKTADAKTADARTADAKTADAKTADAKTADAKTADAKSVAEARREPLVMRVILFRTYALTIALEGPRSSRTALRAIAKTFVPPPARPEGSP